SFWAEARRTGEVLHRTLVPESLRAPLKRLTGGPLLVRTDVRGLPWEVVHDGEDFWGLSFAIGTQIVARDVGTAAAPPTAVTTPRPRPGVLVIGSDADGDLGFVRSEVDTVVRLLQPVADVHCVSGALASFPAVTARLAD